MKILTHLDCLEHRVPFGFPEKPERLEGVLSHLRREWQVEELAGETEDLDDAITAVHAERYVSRLEAAVGRGDGLLDSADNPLSPGTWTAARAAVGATLKAADSVALGGAKVALAAVRPPGHHAEQDMAMGFCFFNNVAVAAQHLQNHHGAERIAIFDFDVHHGNGTQHLFENRPDVLYVSTHQHPFYPGTGAADEVGLGAGEGATLNLPLRAGSDDTVHLQVIEERVLPKLTEFGPQFLLLSAGFDSWQEDPVGGMKVSAEGFQQWGRRLGELADEVCGGRILLVLEGGYDLEALPRLVESHLRGLVGRGAE